MLYLFFPQEQGFLAWYVRWLREVSNGYHIFWFGTNLDGDERKLPRSYAQAVSDEEKQWAFSRMIKFPALSEERGFSGTAVGSRNVQRSGQRCPLLDTASS